MHETLRPVLKQLNSKILEMGLHLLRARTPDFDKLTSAQKSSGISHLVSRDPRYRIMVVGMVCGQLNETEFSFYQQNERDVNKRISLMLEERLRSQLAN